MPFEFTRHLKEIRTTAWNRIARQKACVATLGNFDGVHLGHQKILERVQAVSRKTGLEPVAVTFYPHPKQFFKQGKDPFLLTAPWEKYSLLSEELSLQIYNLSFTRGLSNLSPSDFIEGFLVQRLKAKILVLGPDYRFGAKAAGDVNLLTRYLKNAKEEVIVVPHVKKGKNTISSSLIRQYLQEGKVEKANQLLGRKFFYTGTVVQGEGRGRKLGFPTANLETHCRQKLIISDGVYGATAFTKNGSYLAVVNVGKNPTFKTKKTKIEAHFIDFNQDICGQNICMELNSYLRKEIKFKTVDKLICQIKLDIQQYKRKLEKKGENLII